jgi:hypothetical protein
MIIYQLVFPFDAGEKVDKRLATLAYNDKTAACCMDRVEFGAIPQRKLRASRHLWRGDGCQLLRLAVR